MKATVNYNPPLDGVYTCSLYNYNLDEVSRCKVKCQVMQETAKSYLIQLRECTNLRRIGDRLWVRKTSVLIG